MEKAVEFLLNLIPFLNRRFDPHMREVAVGASIAFLLRILGVGLNFFFSLLLAKICGAEEAGAYYLALTVASIATGLGQLGLQNTLLRFTAAHAVIGDWKSVLGLYSKGMKLVFVVSALLSIALFWTAPALALSIFHKTDLAGPIRWMSLSVVPMSLLALHAQMLQGLKRIGDSIFVSSVGIYASALIFFLILGSVYKLEGAIGAYVLGTLLTMVLGMRFWRAAVPRPQKEKGYFSTHELLKSSVPLFWVSILNIVTSYFSTIFLGIWDTKADVGIFGTASKASMVISFVLVAVNTISAPKFAELYKQKEIAALSWMARRSTKMMTLIASPLVIFCFLCPGFVMGLFGPDFKPGASILVILVVGQFINVLTGSVGYLLMMSGNEKLIRNSTVLTAVVSLLLNLVLIPSRGMTGAAIATSICLAIGNLLNAYLVWTKLGIWTLPLFNQGKTN